MFKNNVLLLQARSAFVRFQGYAEHRQPGRHRRHCSGIHGLSLAKVKMYKPIKFPFYFFPHKQELYSDFFVQPLFFTRGSASNGWRLTSFKRCRWTNPRSKKRLLHFTFGGARVQGHSALFQGQGPDLCACPLDNAGLCSSSKASLLSHAVPKELCR